MARLRAFALLLAAALGSLAALAQSQQIYRWKDAKGRQHVTNSPPPPGAVPLDVPPVTSPPPAAPAPGSTLPPAAPAPAAARPEAPEWKGFEERLESARRSRNLDRMAVEADGVLDEAFWGGTTKALPLLPVATFALAVLLGWWVGSGLRRGPATVVMAVAVLGGLALAQFTLATFLYRSQAARVSARVNALGSHLGPGRAWRPETSARLKAHLQALEAKASPLEAPWAFPREAQALRDTLPQALLDP
ncbi:MAG: DUF4124 domain-containing protein [Holophagaceae bacterium]